MWVFEVVEKERRSGEEGVRGQEAVEDVKKRGAMAETETKE